MPTVILLDVSLSMSRPVSTGESTEEFQRRHLAIHGINKFLDHLSSHAKQEFVALVRCVSYRSNEPLSALGRNASFVMFLYQSEYLHQVV